MILQVLSVPVIPTDDVTLGIIVGLFAIPIISLLKKWQGDKWDKYDNRIASAGISIFLAIAICMGNGQFDLKNLLTSGVMAMFTAHRVYESIGMWFKKNDGKDDPEDTDKPTE